jgi:protein TonB
MKAHSQSAFAAGTLLSGLLVLLAGCAGTPTRQSSLESTFAAVDHAEAVSRFSPPVAVNTVPAEYPYELKRAGIEGLVRLQCVVDVEGRVSDARVEDASHPEFVTPAIAAVKRWTFKPATRDGATVPTAVSVPIRFTLAD